jgi:hypothetical protein
LGEARASGGVISQGFAKVHRIARPMQDARDEQRALGGEERDQVGVDALEADPGVIREIGSCMADPREECQDAKAPP